MLIDGSIGMRVRQHILQGLECEWIEFGVVALPSCEGVCGIVDIELSEH